MDAAGRGRDASGALVRVVPEPALLLCMLRAYVAAGAEFVGNAGEVMGELRTHAAYMDEGPAGRELRAQAAAVMRSMGSGGSAGVAAKAPVRRTSVADDAAALKAAERVRATSASVAAAFDAPFDAESEAPDVGAGGRRRGGAGRRGELR
jgi:hypothetical protein